MKPNFANPLGWMPTYAVQMLTATPSQPDFVPWGLMLTVYRDEKSDCVPIWGVPPATSVQAAILDKFDVAVAQEIVKVASQPYNSNEVCREFASRLRKRIAADDSEVPEVLNLNDPGVRHRLATQWGYVRADSGR